MDNRQSDSFIIQLMRSNNLGGKGATCGDTCCGNLFSAQGLVKTGLWIQWGMLIDTQVFVRKSATWGVQCRKASRWDLLGACLARGTSTNQIRTFGSLEEFISMLCERRNRFTHERTESVSDVNQLTEAMIKSISIN